MFMTAKGSDKRPPSNLHCDTKDLFVVTKMRVDSQSVRAKMLHDFNQQSKI